MNKIILILGIISMLLLVSCEESKPLETYYCVEWGNYFERGDLDTACLDFIKQEVQCKPTELDNGTLVLSQPEKSVSFKDVASFKASEHNFTFEHYGCTKRVQYYD